jgi:hypothetical protein
MKRGGGRAAGKLGKGRRAVAAPSRNFAPLCVGYVGRRTPAGGGSRRLDAGF